MKDILIVLSAVVGGCLLVLIAALVLGGGELGLMKLFAPVREEIRREVYEESRAHVEGANAELSRLRFEYQTAETEGHKNALRQMIISEADRLGRADVNPELQAFVESIR